MKQYELLDSGNLRKLERFGEYVLSRPCSQAIWKKSLSDDVWRRSDASFLREGEKNWNIHTHLPDAWWIEIDQIKLKVSPTDFGHLGVFPEHAHIWSVVRNMLKTAKRSTPPRVLNLFAYSGALTLAAAQAGAHVCHLDSSKGMVHWAKENAKANGLEHAPIRYIVDDVLKFVRREERRASLYDAIILDPPTFGRGAQGELFKIEEHLIPLLEQCRTILSKEPLFVLLSCHTPGITALSLQQLLLQTFPKGEIEKGELLLKSTISVPSGFYAYLKY
jgi:23S rRNA (cytosine1962-C5)-methyltransferase